MRGQGASLNEIASCLNIAKSSVSVWTRDISLTKLQKNRLKEKEKLGGEKGRQATVKKWTEYRKRNPKVETPSRFVVNRRRTGSFFNTWTAKSAYVLGFFAADGCMYHSRNGGFYNGGYYIEFSSIDEDLLKLVRQLMNITNKIEDKVSCKKEYHLSRKRQYKIRIVSKNAFERLLVLGFSPAKSMNLEFPNVPTQYMADFIRGYFDGDGHVSAGQYQSRDRRSLKTYFQSGFTSGSRKFLEQLQRILVQKAKIGRGSLHVNGTCWELSYSTRDTSMLYTFMYPNRDVFCLARKKKVFQRYLDERDKFKL